MLAYLVGSGGFALVAEFRRLGCTRLSLRLTLVHGGNRLNFLGLSRVGQYVPLIPTACAVMCVNSFFIPKR